MIYLIVYIYIYIIYIYIMYIMYRHILMKYIMFYIISLPKNVAKKNDTVILSFLQLNKITWNKNPWYNGMHHPKPFNMLQYHGPSLRPSGSVPTLQHLQSDGHPRLHLVRNVWKAHLAVEIAIWGGKKKVFRHLEIRNGLDNSKKVMCEFFFDKSILPTDVHICAHLQINLIVQLYL